MELQQQQQQLISMEGIENSNFRAVLTKLINVMLALLAVVLVTVSTVASLLAPFLTSRLYYLIVCFSWPSGFSHLNATNNSILRNVV
jgi:Predicted transmembrane and coiled-coil 2 protein